MTQPPDPNEGWNAPQQPSDPFAPPPEGGTPPPPPAQPAGYGPPPGYPPPNYGPPGYGQQPAYGYPAPTAGTNTLAIIALVASFFCSPAGLVMGFIARGQIKQSGQGGSGIALAAIIISAVSIVVGVLAFGSLVLIGSSVQTAP